MRVTPRCRADQLRLSEAAEREARECLGTPKMPKVITHARGIRCRLLDLESR